MVWDDELYATHRSQAEDAYDLPDAFNQRGYNWVDNAMKRLRTEMMDVLTAAFARMPANILRPAITIR